MLVRNVATHPTQLGVTTP